jgi:spermidine/putrescine transport system permease protein
VEQHLRADHPGLSSGPGPAHRRASSGRRWRRGSAPYGLSAGGAIWLLVFFVIPMFSMVILSLKSQPVSNSFRENPFRFTWAWENYRIVWSLYHAQLWRSLWYSGAVTAGTLAVGYPVAYWIAFHAGRHKSTFLFLLLLPFFVSFVIRALVWQFILSDEGFVFRFLEAVHLLPHNFRVLGTPYAVIWGISYNALPFMVLPLYVALEKVDRRAVEAAKDLYAKPTMVFWKVILPLSLPGVFAGILLTFVPAAGDYVEAALLGSPHTTMVGQVIQFLFLQGQQYSQAAALSNILMLLLLVGILLYAKALGTRQIDEYV